MANQKPLNIGFLSFFLLKFSHCLCWWIFYLPHSFTDKSKGRETLPVPAAGAVAASCAGALDTFYAYAQMQRSECAADSVVPQLV
jgi:hypothetical protein